VTPDPTIPRHDWTRAEVEALFELPFTELVFRAAAVHRRWFDPAEVQLSQLLSVKTGGCAENCGYCSQSAHFDTGLKASRLMDPETVLEAARAAKAGGAQRFCMGAAWRELKDRDVPALATTIGGVKALGLETCATLGMLTAEQAQALKTAGLDYYNHNLDTAPDDYARVVSTRTYQDRLETLEHVRDAGMSVCCGGIVGMGETRRARAGLLHALATLPAHPDSLPVNALVPDRGHAAGRRRAGGGDARRAGVRAHGGGGAAGVPEGGGTALGRTGDDEPGAAGAVLPRGRQFDLRGRPPADHRQPGEGRGRAALRRPRPAADGSGAGGGLRATCSSRGRRR
jgi:biotin synthase